MIRSKHTVGAALVSVCAAIWLVPRAAAAETDRPQLAAVARQAATAGERYWRRIENAEPYETMAVRKLFAYSLALAEASVHPERHARLFELAAEMRDRDTESPGYGNFRWYWRDDRVTDRNAVEFCMQDATLLWRRHRDGLPEPARRALEELIRYGLEGCLRHRVATSYTNIAILNACNLVLLGELLDRPDAADEGYRRLEAICLWTWQFGTHEYCSPTYYYPDLTGLLFIEAFADRDEGRRQARALAEFFWTDVALNWFDPAGRLGGSQSRSYDYLRGLGGLDRILWVHGWIGGQMPDPGALIHPFLARWEPPGRLHQLSLKRFPRLVRQSWGPTLVESRTHMMYPDVTLGSSAAAYRMQDMPLTVDPAGDRDEVRCYFIADGREDPYGKKKYETSSARHAKALHLWPFWAAAQRGPDAVGLVVYRDEDLPSDLVTNVQSHFVFRRRTDGLFAGGEPVELARGTPEKPVRVPLRAGDPVVLRYGTAAVGIRVLWSRAQNGSPGRVSLVDDGNTFGALRLTVDHRSESPTAEAGAAFWVRVGSGLESNAAFEAWRSRFEQADSTAIKATADHVRLAVPGQKGAVSVAAEAPYGRAAVTLVPEPSRAALELDGEEIGRPLLESIEPVRSYRDRLQTLQPVDVPAEGRIAFEAEAGLLFPGMTEGEDPNASGGRYVWHPNDHPVGRRTGTITWPLQVAHAGRYWLWGRVLATTGKNDSFYVQLSDADGRERMPAGAWHTGHAGRWAWEPIKLELAKEPSPLDLPAGSCRLVLSVRESGAKIDRLLITSDPNETPP